MIQDPMLRPSDPPLVELVEALLALTPTLMRFGFDAPQRVPGSVFTPRWRGTPASITASMECSSFFYADLTTVPIVTLRIVSSSSGQPDMRLQWEGALTGGVGLLTIVRMCLDTADSIATQHDQFLAEMGIEIV